MGDSTFTQPAKLLGVDISVIEGFLTLIKEKYHVIDMANFFLEIKGGISGINIAMANQRDFLSHLCTVLTETSLTPEQQQNQLSAAEEHLRRAVIESYQKAVEAKLESSLRAYEDYKQIVIPYKKRYPALADAPEISKIRERLKRIGDLRRDSRDAKSVNRWDSRWEDGVQKYIDAYLEIEDINNTLEDYLVLALQEMKARNTKQVILQTVVTASILVNVALIAALFLT